MSLPAHMRVPGAACAWGGANFHRREDAEEFRQLNEGFPTSSGGGIAVPANEMPFTGQFFQYPAPKAEWKRSPYVSQVLRISEPWRTVDGWWRVDISREEVV